ncbi:type II toxin-antitoxin system RelE family toxin [Actinomycetota bacterium]
MTYAVTLAPAAARALRKLDRPAQARIQAVIDLLASDPRPPGARKLAGGEGEWRVRSGDYRVIYEINDGVLCVLVLAVGHRREIYQRR